MQKFTCWVYGDIIFECNQQFTAQEFVNEFEQWLRSEMYYENEIKILNITINGMKITELTFDTFAKLGTAKPAHVTWDLNELDRCVMFATLLSASCFCDVLSINSLKRATVVTPLTQQHQQQIKSSLYFDVCSKPCENIIGVKANKKSRAKPNDTTQQILNAVIKQNKIFEAGKAEYLIKKGGWKTILKEIEDLKKKSKVCTLRLDAAEQSDVTKLQERKEQERFNEKKVEILKKVDALQLGTPTQTMLDKMGHLSMQAHEWFFHLFNTHRTKQDILLHGFCFYFSHSDVLFSPVCARLIANAARKKADAAGKSNVYIYNLPENEYVRDKFLFAHETQQPHGELIKLLDSSYANSAAYLGSQCATLLYSHPDRCTFWYVNEIPQSMSFLNCVKFLKTSFEESADPAATTPDLEGLEGLAGSAGLAGPAGPAGLADLANSNVNDVRLSIYNGNIFSVVDAQLLNFVDNSQSATEQSWCDKNLLSKMFSQFAVVPKTKRDTGEGVQIPEAQLFALILLSNASYQAFARVKNFKTLGTFNQNTNFRNFMDKFNKQNTAYLKEHNMKKYKLARRQLETRKKTESYELNSLGIILSNASNFVCPDDDAQCDLKENLSEVVNRKKFPITTDSFVAKTQTMRYDREIFRRFVLVQCMCIGNSLIQQIKDIHSSVGDDRRDQLYTCLQSLIDFAKRELQGDEDMHDKEAYAIIRDLFEEWKTQHLSKDYQFHPKIKYGKQEQFQFSSFRNSGVKGKKQAKKRAVETKRHLDSRGGAAPNKRPKILVQTKHYKKSRRLNRLGKLQWKLPEIVHLSTNAVDSKFKFNEYLKLIECNVESVNQTILIQCKDRDGYAVAPSLDAYKTSFESTRLPAYELLPFFPIDFAQQAEPAKQYSIALIAKCVSQKANYSFFADFDIDSIKKIIGADIIESKNLTLMSEADAYYSSDEDEDDEYLPQ